MQQWLEGLESDYLSPKMLKHASRKTLWSLLTFLTGWAPEDAKVAGNRAGVIKALKAGHKIENQHAFRFTVSGRGSEACAVQQFTSDKHWRKPQMPPVHAWPIFPKPHTHTPTHLSPRQRTNAGEGLWIGPRGRVWKSASFFGGKWQPSWEAELRVIGQRAPFFTRHSAFPA